MVFLTWLMPDVRRSKHAFAGGVKQGRCAPLVGWHRSSAQPRVRWALVRTPFTSWRLVARLGSDMNLAPTNVRRATVDDIEDLRELWLQAHLPAEELERHLTEFQLVLSTTGEMVGAIGLHIQGKQGKLHSEAFIHPEHEDDFRPVLWERVKTVARNHGLVWLWTQELAPFYHHNGFQDADEETRKKLPPGFGDPDTQWSAMQLRDEAVLSLDKEFELFHQTETESTELVLRQARLLKVVATVIAVILFAVVAVGLYYLFRQGRLPSGR